MDNVVIDSYGLVDAYEIVDAYGYRLVYILLIINNYY